MRRKMGAVAVLLAVGVSCGDSPTAPEEVDEGEPSSGGELTKTVFEGTCMANGATGFDVGGGVEDGDVVSDTTITLTDPPLVWAYVHKPFDSPSGAYETHRDFFQVQEGKFIISCPSVTTHPDGTEGPPGWDYKIVMIK